MERGQNNDFEMEFSFAGMGTGGLEEGGDDGFKSFEGMGREECGLLWKRKGGGQEDVYMLCPRVRGMP